MEALYIEDDLIQQRLMSLYLTDMDITLHLASTGKDGLSLIHKVLPSFIIMDLFLSDMDGIEVLKQLKENPRVKDIPVIVVSADLLIHKKFNLWDDGAWACLIKPVSKSQIAALVRQLFG